ncbi:MAG: hypothetical protein K6G81_12915 [Lachnospiraceae bacterium]|nr:hypothetical protein [Lachnospiraceae bacterium]
MNDKDELTMQVSGICVRNGKKVAYVTFTGRGLLAEGVIPECRIEKLEGFSEEEKGQLELFMKMNLSDLKKRAAKVDPLRAIMKDPSQKTCQGKK